MASTSLFKVVFQIRKSNSGNFQGKVDVYRKDKQVAIVAAATSHPKDILSVLTSNFTLTGSETIDVLEVAGVSIGTEGANVLT